MHEDLRRWRPTDRLTMADWIGDRPETVLAVHAHVVPSHRRQGLGTRTAHHASCAVQQAGLVPVWGAGEHNVGSRRLAERLGFVEVARLTYLVLAGSG